MGRREETRRLGRLRFALGASSPPFSEGCPPAMYLAAMVWLYRYPDRPLMGYNDVPNEINLGRILHYLCGYIVFWADPLWRPPYKTSNEVTTSFYEYEDIIRNVWLDPPTYTNDREKDDQIDKDRVDTVEKFMTAWRKRVRSTYYEWDKFKQNDFESALQGQREPVSEGLCESTR
ncbi:hypothetical protein GJ744_005998 [Endocarpon pusillum]|uniref:Uncharacterized protein n=1 Tax=Endocarpon pusillum TaxID=364733 RepID=A0A8H7A820_9EURO|nr:hypothetical protein GJ744_005998 [Endocarpon pusillum]